MDEDLGKRFEGRRALIIGDAGAIGSATAFRLLGEGAEIILWIVMRLV